MAMMRLAKLTQMQLTALRQMLRILLTRAMRQIVREGKKPELPEADTLLKIMTANEAFLDLDAALLSLWSILRAKNMPESYLPMSQNRHVKYLTIVEAQYTAEDYPNVPEGTVNAALEPVLLEQPGLVAAFRDAAWIAEKDLPGNDEKGVFVTQIPETGFLN